MSWWWAVLLDVSEVANGQRFPTFVAVGEVLDSPELLRRFGTIDIEESPAKSDVARTSPAKQAMGSAVALSSTASDPTRSLTATFESCVVAPAPPGSGYGNEAGDCFTLNDSGMFGAKLENFNTLSFWRFDVGCKVHHDKS